MSTSAQDGWKYDFGELERYDEDGREIEYTVDEEIVRGYGRSVNNGEAVETTNNNVGVKLFLTENASIGDGTLDIYYTKDSKWYRISVSAPIAGKTIYVPTYTFWARLVTTERVFGIATERTEYVSGQRPAGEVLSQAPAFEETGSAGTAFSILYPSAGEKYIRFNLGNTADHTGITDAVSFLDLSVTLENGIENIKLPDPFDISFKKVDTNGTMLSGAQFKLTGREDGAHYDIIPITFTSSSDEVSIKQLRPGTYHLSETKAPAGCMRVLHDVDFKVGEDGTVTISDEEVDIVSVTDQETVFKIFKIDKDTEEAVPGAVFQILTSDGDPVAEWTTDSEVKTFRGVLDVETEYTLHEKSHPDNYKPVPDLTFSLNPDGTVQVEDSTADYLEVRSGVLTVLEEKTSVKFKKLNENGDPVIGAQFTLTGTGTPAFTRTWTSDGTDHLISGIPAGQYTLSETSPSGYTAISPVTLTIDEMSAVTIEGSNNEGQVLVDENDVSLVVVTNRYTRHNLAVSKRVEGNFGNRTKEFSFTLTLEEAEGGAKLPQTITGVKALEDGTTESSEYEILNGVLIFTLRDGVSIQFENIPYGMGYKVEEDASSSKGYEVTSENEEGTITQDAEVSFVNRKDSIVPTLLDTSNPVMLVMIALILLIGILIFRRRKRLS